MASLAPSDSFHYPSGRNILHFTNCSHTTAIPSHQQTWECTSPNLKTTFFSECLCPSSLAGCYQPPPCLPGWDLLHLGAVPVGRLCRFKPPLEHGNWAPFFATLQDSPVVELSKTAPDPDEYQRLAKGRDHKPSLETNLFEFLLNGPQPGRSLHAHCLAC